MTTLYATEGDIGRVISATLYADGVAVDLTGEDVECHLLETSTAAVVEITGLVGDANGVVSTELPSSLPEGRYTMEWQVVGGVTYPAPGKKRPVLIVRTEVS